MIRALVFDFDGVIVDTETALVEAWVQVHHEAGVPCDRADALAVVGHVDMAFDQWAAFAPGVDRTELQATYRRLIREILQGQPILPGVERLIAEAHAAGWRLAIASNSSHDWVDAHLARLGLAPSFALVRCREDVPNGKPAPDLYLAATAALGVAPAEAVAVEDSVPGHLAAHAAGLACVVVPNPSTLHCAFDRADLQLTSLAETSVADLQRRFGARRA